jgi:hypothetical protein
MAIAHLALKGPSARAIPEDLTATFGRDSRSLARREAARGKVSV